MTRPADPRGADRRKPSTFGADTGYDRGGVMFTRCTDHQPAGSRDCGPVRGACPECARVTQ